MMLEYGLNQVTMSEVPLRRFLETAQELGCVGVELRNDLARPLFDGLAPKAAGEMVRDHGLRLLGVSQIYPFNRWSAETAEETARLIEVAKLAGAEAISLIPCNDGSGLDVTARSRDLTTSLEACLPMLRDAELTGLIEPLGFERASLRLKSEVVAAVERLGAAENFKLVHDTFHHALTGEAEMYPAHTGIVHISGVTAEVPFSAMEDAHRVLVDANDRLENLPQINALADAGYKGVLSFECFADQVRALPDASLAIKESMNFITRHLLPKAA